MKKSLLIVPMLCLGLFAKASNDGSTPKKPMPKEATSSYKVLGKNLLPAKKAATNNTSRALSTVQLGSAGNLLTMFNSTQNQVFADDSTHAVVFIHRRDASATNNPGGNVGQYVFDISKDDGATWTTNVGPVNPAGITGTAGYNGRFPQAAIYRPAGQTNPDSSWFVYSGTWHNGAGSGNDIWEGECRGVSRLTGAPSTYTQSWDMVNGGNVAVASSFIQTTPGTFFNLHLDYHTISGTQTEIKGLVIMKGTWNSTTNSTAWTETLLPITFESTTDGTNDFSNAGTPTIAFDPTGQIGYIAMIGDLVIGDGDFLSKLIYFKTTDGGATWSAPTSLEINQMPGIETVPIVDNSTGDTIPTGWFPIGDFDLAVDKNGGLHVGCILAIGDRTQDAYYPNAPILATDLFYSPTASLACTWNGWTGSFLNLVNSTRGVYTSGGQSDPAAEYNRMQTSRTADGSKIFFIWNDSDTTVTLSASTASERNASPDVWAIGLDVVTNTLTLPKNITKDDADFGGLTATFPGGNFGGALYHTVAPTTRATSATTFNIPLVLTQIDYGAGVGNIGSADNPAKFYYVNNVNFAQADFTESNSSGSVVITLNGSNPVYVENGTAYADSGATAVSCVYGSLTPSAVNTVNTAVNGSYTVTWSATDSAGATGQAVRTVIVLSKPVAKIWYQQQTCARFLFADSSNDANRTAIVWYVDGAQNVNPSFVKTFTTNGTKQVVMCITNPLGSDCDTVSVNACVGIDDPSISAKINVYPVPTAKNVIVDLNSFVNQEVSLTLSSVIGNVVIPTQTTKNGGNVVMTTEGLQNGVYLLKIQTPQGNSIKQIIVQK